MIKFNMLKDESSNEVDMAKAMPYVFVIVGAVILGITIMIFLLL